MEIKSIEQKVGTRVVGGRSLGDTSNVEGE